MNINRRSILVFAVSIASISPVFAQPASPMAEGEVRRVDREGMRITIKHGEIKSIDMPPMTMVFGVKDAKQLDGLETGSKIRFAAASENGKYVVNRIELVK